MSKFIDVFTSSIGRKIVMSLTGLFLFSFLIIHVSGNTLLFHDDGGEAFNAYSQFMAHNPIIRTIEILLFAGFILHIIQSLIITIKNRGARQKSYDTNKANQNSNWYSRNMGFFGVVLLIFLIVHLGDYFFESRFTDEISYDVNGNINMYDEVAASFKNGYYSAFYIVCMVFLAFHLIHGFQSAFQSLGLRHKMYTQLIRFVGISLSIIIPALFAAMPVYFYFKP
ncbi:MAG TPA: succinate dehydrogenase cytochrome b subunit [Bacteroidia bacterium]|nr:succinate dehydrogenase cytochrome b subunit [Bacteroidia bacterium]HNT79227.1 succinate dehydrogenase cytochrome b subunit [Bacteroidia bacterium]